MENLSQNFQKWLTQEIDFQLIATSLILAIVILIILALIILLPKLFRVIRQSIIPEEISTIYQKVVAPFQNWIALTSFLIATDISFQYFLEVKWINIVEVPLALVIAGLISWVGASIFSRYFDAYLLDAAIQSKRKINSELLLLGKLLLMPVLF